MAIKVSAFTGGADVPSARFRVRQYIPHLKALGLNVREVHPPFGKYPPKSLLLRPLWGCMAIGGLLPRALSSWNDDVVLLQREMISKLFTFENLTKRPRVLDVDDAIYEFGNGRLARRLASISDRIVCGNETLANWFEKIHSDVRIVATPVDTRVYLPTTTHSPDSEPRIGWIGTSPSLPFLTHIEAALKMTLDVVPRARLLIVSDRPPSLSTISSDRIEYVKWSEREEVRLIQKMTVGIMPLDDTVWTRGKCSFKMLQYMACAKPSVVSPIGMNSQVLRETSGAVAASSTAEWVDALVWLLENPESAIQKGWDGRRLVERQYSVTALAPALAAALRP